ncbi:MAG: hypothetical protein HBSAPP04_23210 [Ignavibacteriaceae bacterium]|nr:MAG: T9SS C-terminal target domain-containing protein [Chlorobiota bacterium]GJQ33482.1 MAG: hypothetical protein HBSAPP04_23210 [Ignavibacteriaceae bacterium]
MKTFVTLFLITVKIFSQPISFPLDTVAANDLFNNRQTMALDSNDVLHIVYSGSQGSTSSTREIFYAVERGNGEFETTQITTDNLDQNYPTISIDGNGKIHIGMIGYDTQTSNYQVKYTNNVSGAFFPPRSITTGGLNKATPGSAVGPDGRVHFAYFTYADGADKAYYRWYNPADSTMSPEVYLADGETSGDLDAQVMFDGNGKLHILLKAGGVFTGQLKYFNDISGTLQEVQTGVSVNVANARLVIDSNNKVHIVFRNDSTDRLNYINNISGGFSSPVIFSPAGQMPAGYSNIAIDDNDRIYVIYQSSQSASGKGFYLIHGKDGVFSDTMLVFAAGSPYVTRNTSAVVARGNGEVAMTFSPALVRNSLVICDILYMKGKLFKEPAILVKDSVMDFGVVPVNGMGNYDLYIWNKGDTTLHINRFSWTKTDFSIRLDYPEYIAPGDSDLANFALFPLSPGPKLDTLRIYSNDPQDSVITVIMKGYVEGNPAISVSKDSMFLQYTTGWFTRDSFYVKNTGFDTLAVDTIFASGWLDFYLMIDPPNGQLIPPGDSVMVYVELMIPVTEAPPVFDDTLFIHSNDPLKPVSIIFIKWELPQSAESEVVPLEYGLEQNFPNPFNPETVIDFSLKKEGFVTLEIFNSTGEKIRTLVSSSLAAGKHSVRFDAATLPSGVYLYRLNAGDFTSTRKMLLLR